MIIYVDIDETICTTPGSSSEARDYSLAAPIVENIKAINKYYDMGHTIVYWTARGSGTGIDWTDVTEQQLTRWNAKWHELKLGKPVYDIFLDDKALNSRDWENADRCLPKL